MIAEVIVDILNSNVDRIYDYSVPLNSTYSLGQRVLVPFGKRFIEGYITNLKSTTLIDTKNLKSIIKPLDDYAVLLPEMIMLSKFMVENFNLRVMDTLRLFLPSGMRKDKAKVKVVKLCNLNTGNNLTLNKRATKQQQVVEFLKQNRDQNISLLFKQFGNNAINVLIEKNIIVVKEVNSFNKFNYILEKTENNVFKLTDCQKNALEKIESSNKPILLFGVTGSGKTEVYLNVIEAVLKQHKTAIMLVPEISLTPQIFKIFNNRFKDEVAILHSGLSVKERFDEWQRIFRGNAKIVVGARSAIFAPLENIGAIIIDEEHDTSYFSETNPRYSTLEIAEFRSKFNNSKLILGSATPSVVSFQKTTTNDYTLVEMPIRINSAPMPKFEIVDMCTELKSGNSSVLSNALLTELKKCVENNKQAIIFLNRRGYNSFVMCKECGFIAKCEDCDVPLVYHKDDNELKCHFCSKRYKMLTRCPNCNSTYIKFGAVGTQKIVESLKEVFKNTKIFRMDNDSTRTKNAHYKILSEFENTKPSILVGTQMIAKGHDFPLVTTVGIIDADLGLHFADFRATERTFQLVTQVAGRAGRGEYEGKIILQTYVPKHYVYRYATNYDYANYFKKEINIREVTNFPPYSFIVRILISGENEKKVLDILRSYYDEILNLKENKKSDFIYLNKMKSPIKRIKTKFRYQILMRITPNNFDVIKKEIFKINNTFNTKDVTIFVEINPQNLS